MKHLKLFEQKEEAKIQKAVQKKLKKLSKEGQAMFLEDILQFIKDYQKERATHYKSLKNLDKHIRHLVDLTNKRLKELVDSESSPTISPRTYLDNITTNRLRKKIGKNFCTSPQTA